MADNILKHSQTATALLKANLGFFSAEIPTDLETYLLYLLDKAFADFGEMGIHLQIGTLSDDFDQATFAAWMYRNGPTGGGKTEVIKSIIRNRQVNQALKDPEDNA